MHLTYLVNEESGKLDSFSLSLRPQIAGGSLFDNMTNMVNLGYNAFMRTVKIGDLKAQLSAHLQFVKLRHLASKSAALSLAASLFHRERRDPTYPRQIR